MLILGFIYSLMVNANINGVGHNFIHNPFFRSELLNRLFGVTQSIACCFSQTYYNVVRTRVIRRAHMLGFLDPDLPKRGDREIKPQAAEATS